MSSADLLRYHAQTLLDSNLHPPEKKRRLNAKTGMSKNQVLKQLVQNPTKVVAEASVTWVEKRHLSHFVAHVAAAQFELRVVLARRLIKGLWLNVSQQELQNWRLIEVLFGKPSLALAKDGNVLDDSIELYGGLFTWHTLLARHSELITRMIAAACDQGHRRGCGH